MDITRFQHVRITTGAYNVTTLVVDVQHICRVTKKLVPVGARARTAGLEPTVIQVYVYLF